MLARYNYMVSNTQAIGGFHKFTTQLYFMKHKIHFCYTKNKDLHSMTKKSGVK